MNICTLSDGLYLKLELLGHRIYIDSTLVDTTKQISEVVCQITLSPAMSESSGCFIALPALGIDQPFNFSQSGGWGVIPSLMMTDEAEHLSKSLLDIWIPSFGKS